MSDIVPGGPIDAPATLPAVQRQVEARAPGRPRKCQHPDSDRRRKVVTVNGKRYETTYCRPCATAYERERTARARAT